MSEDKKNNIENIILNEEEKRLLLDHNYDGIEEFDNPLPAWWVWIYIGCCIFGLFYLYFYHFADGRSLKTEYQIANAKIELIREAAQKKMDKFDEKEYNSWIAANDGINKGKEVFMDNCAACHTESGGGDVGPNLTDHYWMHMKKVTSANIFKVVKNGVEDMGMPVWGEVLSKEEIFAAVAYVKNVLHNKNVKGGKPPYGEKVDD